MSILIHILIGFIALLHFLFLILEMFLWDKPKGLKVFGHSLADAKKTALLAKNQGLYNGFLSAGLIWSVSPLSTGFSLQLQYFFLTCVLMAGLYGGYTVAKKILLLQALPAGIALILLILS